jgi:host factor-I protein
MTRVQWIGMRDNVRRLARQVPLQPVRYNHNMPPDNASRRRQKSPPSGETGQEALYLRSLSERQVQVHVKLRDGETVSGWIEYFDDKMIRLTREGKPNLFIYKSQIRTITEHARDASRRSRSSGSAAPPPREDAH